MESSAQNDIKNGCLSSDGKEKTSDDIFPHCDVDDASGGVLRSCGKTSLELIAYDGATRQPDVLLVTNVIEVSSAKDDTSVNSNSDTSNVGSMSSNCSSSPQALEECSGDEKDSSSTHNSENLSELQCVSSTASPGSEPQVSDGALESVGLSKLAGGISEKSDKLDEDVESLCKPFDRGDQLCSGLNLQSCEDCNDVVDTDIEQVVKVQDCITVDDRCSGDVKRECLPCLTDNLGDRACGNSTGNNLCNQIILKNCAAFVVDEILDVAVNKLSDMKLKAVSVKDGISNDNVTKQNPESGEIIPNLPESETITAEPQIIDSSEAQCSGTGSEVTKAVCGSSVLNDTDLRIISDSLAQLSVVESVQNNVKIFDSIQAESSVSDGSSVKASSGMSDADEVDAENLIKVSLEPSVSESVKIKSEILNLSLHESESTNSISDDSVSASLGADKINSNMSLESSNSPSMTANCGVVDSAQSESSVINLVSGNVLSKNEFAAVSSSCGTNEASIFIQTEVASPVKCNGSLQNETVEPDFSSVVNAIQCDNNSHAQNSIVKEPLSEAKVEIIKDCIEDLEVATPCTVNQCNSNTISPPSLEENCENFSSVSILVVSSDDDVLNSSDLTVVKEVFSSEAKSSSIENCFENSDLGDLRTLIPGALSNANESSCLTGGEDLDEARALDQKEESGTEIIGSVQKKLDDCINCSEDCELTSSVPLVIPAESSGSNPDSHCEEIRTVEVTTPIVSCDENRSIDLELISNSEAKVTDSSNHVEDIVGDKNLCLDKENADVKEAAHEGKNCSVPVTRDLLVASADTSEACLENPDSTSSVISEECLLLDKSDINASKSTVPTAENVPLESELSKSGDDDNSRPPEELNLSSEVEAYASHNSANLNEVCCVGLTEVKEVSPAIDIKISLADDDPISDAMDDDSEPSYATSGSDCDLNVKNAKLSSDGMNSRGYMPLLDEDSNKSTLSLISEIEEVSVREENSEDEEMGVRDSMPLNSQHDVIETDDLENFNNNPSSELVQRVKGKRTKRDASGELKALLPEEDTVSEDSSAEHAAKIKEIKDVLATDTSLGRLRELARSEGGLINDEIRREAWPRLLGVDTNAPPLTPISQEELRAHPEYNQVVLDVNRSLRRFPSRISPEERQKMQDQLTEIIVRVLLRRRNLYYYQGYHDVAVTTLLVAGKDTAFHILDRISTTHLSDCMLPTMDRTLYLLNYIYPLLQRINPHVVERMDRLEIGTIFCLPWFLTWYGYSLKRYEDVVRLFDYFIASPPLAPLYLAAVVVGRRSAEVLSADCDHAIVHSLLSKIPTSLPLEDLLLEASLLYEEHPPSEIDVEVRDRCDRLKRAQEEEEEERRRNRQMRLVRRHSLPVVPVNMLPGWYFVGRLLPITPRQLLQVSVMFVFGVMAWRVSTE